MSQQPSARSGSSLVELVDGPGPPRDFGGPSPNLLDENWVMQALNATFNFHMLTADAETKQMVFESLRPFVPAFNGLWDVLYRAIDGTTKLATLVGETFLKYWSLVLAPIWQRLFDVLASVYDLMGPPLGTALSGLGYAVNFVLGPTLAWLSALREAVASIPAVLRGARNFVLQGAGAVESLVAIVEVRAGQAFEATVASYNEAATWVNHLVGEEGYYRPLTLVWSLWTYASDAWTTLGNALVTPDSEATWESLAQQWPLVSFATYLLRFQTGQQAGAAQVQAALDRFRSSGL